MDAGVHVDGAALLGPSLREAEGFLRDHIRRRLGMGEGKWADLSSLVYAIAGGELAVGAGHRAPLPPHSFSAAAP